jgi:hypothetical protein
VEGVEALRKACDGRGDAAGDGRSFWRRVVGGGATTDGATSGGTFGSSGWSFGKRMVGGGALADGAIDGGGFSSSGGMSPQQVAWHR